MQVLLIMAFDTQMLNPNIKFEQSSIIFFCNYTVIIIKNKGMVVGWIKR